MRDVSGILSINSLLILALPLPISGVITKFIRKYNCIAWEKNNSLDFYIPTRNCYIYCNIIRRYHCITNQKISQHNSGFTIHARMHTHAHTQTHTHTHTHTHKHTHTTHTHTPHTNTNTYTHTHTTHHTHIYTRTHTRGKNRIDRNLVCFISKTYHVIIMNNSITVTLSFFSSVFQAFYSLKYCNDLNKRPGRLLNFWIFYMGT